VTQHNPLRRALVTGGTGFLGQALVAHLRDSGVEVIAFDMRAHPDPSVNSVVGNICDPAAVRLACAGVDTVFHTAAMIDWGLNKRKQLFAVNVEGTANIVDACRSAGVQRLIYTSTVDVVFGGQPIDGGNEDTPYPSHHLDHYGHSKAVAERAVLAANGAELQTCALRVATLWGPGERFRVTRFVQMARDGKLAALGNGQSRFSHLYIVNAAHAHRIAAERLAAGTGPAGQALFLVDEPPDNFFGFYTPIIEQAGLQANWRWIPAWLLYPFAIVMEWANRLHLTGKDPPLLTRFTVTSTSSHFWFRGERSRQWLGNYNVVPLAQARAETVRWVKEHLLKQ
jgi:nucleoside-diphosphate-sugar epimerase